MQQLQWISVLKFTSTRDKSAPVK